jgi:hypothetical protein
MAIDKNLLKTANGIPLTQGLFLEIGYKDYAVYTTKDDDHDYNGRIYPSLKRLYLEMEDVGEYEFATTYLLGWNHWQRLCANKEVMKHVQEWRDELEIKLRSKAMKTIFLKAQTEQGINAAKWIAERGWDKRKAGRPSKDEVQKQARIEADLYKEFEEDFNRFENRSH